MWRRMARRKLPWRLILVLVVLTTGLLSWVEQAGAASASGPLRVHTSNPRYFTDGSGRVIYLTGSHTWANLQDMGTVDPPPRFDYDSYLDFMESHNHNFMRIWVHEQAKWAPWITGDYYFEPLPYERTGPGLALDGKPKFDLNRFNQAYFDRFRQRIIAAGERGIYVSIMLFNGWSVQAFEKFNFPGNPWLGHPFNRHNNINGIDGDTNNDNQGPEIHTMSKEPQILKVRARQEAYVRQVIDMLNGLDNVLWEIGNEIGSHSTEWQYYMIHLIKDYEARKPKRHPVGMTFQWFDGRNNTLFESQADWVSPNDLGGYKFEPPVADGRKVVLSDTDHLWGIGGNWIWVWKSFLRGLNPIYMDSYRSPDFPPADESARKAMGYTAMYAKKINLRSMVPHEDIASTGYALVNPGSEYLIYLPSNGQPGLRWLDRFELHRWVRWLTQLLGWNESVTVDLSAAMVNLDVEWCNPRTGETMTDRAITGGSHRTFTAPFLGDAVLYLTAQQDDLHR